VYNLHGGNVLNMVAFVDWFTSRVYHAIDGWFTLRLWFYGVLLVLCCDDRLIPLRRLRALSLAMPLRCSVATDSIQVTTLVS
jgi:hypothetical protein